MTAYEEGADNASAISVSNKASSTRATTIGQRLRLDIINGKLLPGSKLHLEELREALGVSLSPLRESLTRLVAEGLVTAQDQRGFTVAPVSKENLLEIIDLRTILETKALRAAIEKGNDDWEAEILSAHHVLSKLDEQRWAEPFFEQWEERHKAFHNALLRACNAPQLLSFCQTLFDMSHRYRRIFVRKNPPRRDIAAEHKQLLSATLKRDADTACRILSHHIETTGKNIVRAMP
jgi:GntR family transcriptional regulator, carbon starvation induced regulator